MTESGIDVGVLVSNPKRPDWGLGKVVAVGSKIHVIFREDPSRAARKFSAEALVKAERQSDPILDNLPEPTLQDGAYVLSTERITPQRAIEIFLERYPGGFYGEKYIGSKSDGERYYKWTAHETFVETLGNGQLEALLNAREIDTAVTRVLRVASQVNLLFSIEAAAFRDALQEPQAAERYLDALLPVIAGPPEERLFNRYLDVLQGLPTSGKMSAAKWPIATLMPFLARPSDFIFIKPEVTKEAAALLGFELRYETMPNWRTYRAALDMMGIYADLLVDLQPRDMIDLQSFIWTISTAYERTVAANAKKRRK